MRGPARRHLACFTGGRARAPRSPRRADRDGATIPNSRDSGWTGGDHLKGNALWIAYAAGDDSARDTLLAGHLGLVHFVAHQIFRNLSGGGDFDELLSAGTLGLIGALESFDIARGLAFSTFATPRIRGAILDELRREDHVSRSVRRKARELAVAREQLTGALGRTPDDRELATRLDVDVPRIWQWKSDIEGATQVSLERPPMHRDGDSPSPGETLSDGAPTIEDLLTHEQEVAILGEALLTLTEQERTVLTLCFYEELRLNEIATVLGVTESRVSQVRTKALARLRALMASRILAA